MSSQVMCGKCSAVLEVDPSWAGRTVSCPGCRSKIKIPGTGATPAGPVLELQERDEPAPAAPPPAPRRGGRAPLGFGGKRGFGRSTVGPRRGPRMGREIDWHARRTLMMGVGLLVVGIAVIAAMALFFFRTKSTKIEYEQKLADTIQQYVTAVNAEDAQGLVELLNADDSARPAEAKRMADIFAKVKVRISNLQIQSATESDYKGTVRLTWTVELKSVKSGKTHTESPTLLIQATWSRPRGRWLLHRLVHFPTDLQ